MVIRKETKARKADRDGQGLPPVPGKDISPYDGRPAAWWRESAGEGRRAEGGGAEEGGREGSESLAECSGGGAGLETGAAHVQVNRETQADGTPFDGAHDGRSVPAASNDKGRGWDSVVVEESDVLACGGYLPERYVGGAGDGDGEAESAGADPGRDEGVGGEGDGSSTPVDCERPPPPGVDTSATRREDCAAPNEPNSCDDVCTTQHHDAIEVATNSGGVSGVEGCQANPISLVTKPIPAGGGVGVRGRRNREPRRNVSDGTLGWRSRGGSGFARVRRRRRGSGSASRG